ncbi:hypothetical protein ACMFMG_003056 [Clarireedia jacksonii]
MAAISSQSRSGSEAMINHDQNTDPDSDIVEITEAEWESAPKLNRISKSTPPTTSGQLPSIKAEPDEIGEFHQVAIPSPAAASATPMAKKRAGPTEESSITGTSEPKDVHIKHEPGIKRESSPPPFFRDISTPPKRRKSLFQNTPFSQMTSTSIQREIDIEGEAQEPEYEFDRENTTESESEIADVQPQLAEKPKKPRAKTVKTAREWWARCYKTKENSCKATRDRRVFANDGAASKVHSFMNHNPITDHNEATQKEVAPDIVATSKKDYFDQVTRNIRTDGRIHDCRGDKTALRIAGESFGRGNVKFDKNAWTVKGMKTSLYHHQLLCASWMLGREFDAEGPSGGFNCDVMGLGKTVEVLATIIGNPRPDGLPRKEVGPTLVVCPSSIAKQWRAEIETHIADDDLNVIVFRKAQKLERQSVQNADMVVTTYNQVMMSCPWPSDKWFADLARSRVHRGGSIDEETAIEEWISENRKEFAGILHQINWYRVVLDEAVSGLRLLANLAFES